MLVLAIAAGVGWGNPVAEKNARGNREYLEARYADALAAYSQALGHEPEHPDVTYNIGNVLYRQGRFEQAAQGYAKALFPDDERRRKEAAYNAGNAFYRLGNLEQAAAYYKKALEMDENDEDARYNLELVLRQMQNQEQQDQEQKDQKQQDQEKEDQNGEDSEQDQQDQGEQQNQQQQPSEADSSQTRQEQMQEAEERKDKMTPEEAARILDALEQEERELRAEQRKQIQRKQDVEKDW